MTEPAAESRNIDAEITQRAVCEAYAESKERDRFPDAILAFHYPHVARWVIDRAMWREVRRGLVECEEDVRLGRLTARGKALLQSLAAADCGQPDVR